MIASEIYQINKKITRFNRLKYRGLDIVRNKTKTLTFKAILVLTSLVATGSYILAHHELNPDNDLFSSMNPIKQYSNWEESSQEEKLTLRLQYFKENYIPPIIGLLCGRLTLWIAYYGYITYPKKKISHRLYLRLLALASASSRDTYNKEDVLELIKAGRDICEKPEDIIKIAKALELDLVHYRS